MLNGLLRGSLAAIVIAGVAALVPQPAAAIDPSYSGSWYNPPESGSGFNLEVYNAGEALLFWYTYDDAGEPVWLYSEGVVDGDTIDFVVFYADGMVFSDLDSADKTNRVWGSLSMQFQDCNTAEITYASTLAGLPHSPVGARTLPVQRLVNIASLPCREPVAGYWVGAHRDPTLDGGAGAFADLSGVLTEDGRVFLSSQLSGDVFVGTWEIVGAQLRFDYEICPDGDGPCVPATATASYAPKDFVRGSGTSAIWGTQPFQASYRTLYDRSVTLASLAGTYSDVDEDGAQTTITITGTGAFSGSNNEGCIFSGQLGQANANFNLFEFAGTISGCGTDTLTGVAVNIDTGPGVGDRKRLEFRVRNNAGAMSFTLQRP